MHGSFISENDYQRPFSLQVPCESRSFPQQCTGIRRLPSAVRNSHQARIADHESVDGCIPSWRAIPFKRGRTLCLEAGNPSPNIIIFSCFRWLTRLPTEMEHTPVDALHSATLIFMVNVTCSRVETMYNHRSLCLLKVLF